VNAIDRIGSYIGEGGGVDAIISDDHVYRDAIERQLLIIAEAASKLRGQVDVLEPAIDWDAIRGMGNVLRHDYDDVNDDIIRHVLSGDLFDLAAACERLRAHFPMSPEA
jgi:uncharacterized protein with HEPN domain